MQEKEKQDKDPIKVPHPQDEQKLSDTIADAHAAGDGALERGKDSLIASDDGHAEEKTAPTGGEAY